jgi:molybdopterin-guanine dinucleotide biosynthesis protein B
MTALTGLRSARVPVLGFVAPSGTGKTTLLHAVIRWLTGQGLRVAVVKQARDDFEVDQPGKDSHRLRKAGVERLLLTSSRQSALIVEHPASTGVPPLDELLSLLDQTVLDVILVEGFAGQPLPRIEVIRGGEPRHYPSDPWIIALAADRLAERQATVPLLDLNDPGAVAAFVRDWLATADDRVAELPPKS